MTMSEGVSGVWTWFRGVALFLVVASGWAASADLPPIAEGLDVPAEVKAAALAGDADAQHIVGLAYAEGRGVPKDDAVAVNWYIEAVAGGSVDAAFSLGLSYWSEEGGPRRDGWAVFYWRLAAEGGHLGAWVGLGRAHEQGRGVPRNDVLAVSWYRKAAEAGDADAQAKLGFAYSLGEGVPRDIVRAYAWFNVAVAQGVDVASSLDVVEERLTPAERAEAQELSRELWERHVMPFQAAPDSRD